MDSVFRSITQFVADLNTEFGSANKPIALYSYLLSKTKLSDSDPVQKHIAAFKEFCTENADAIKEKDKSKLVSPLIKYSPKVFIDIGIVLDKSDANTTAAVWNHIATINNTVFPDNTVALVQYNAAENTEDDIINSLMDTISSSINTSTVTDPFTTAMSLISSGKLTSIIGTMSQHMSSGKLNPHHMLEKVTSMYSDMSKDNPDAPNVKDLLSNILNSQK